MRIFSANHSPIWILAVLVAVTVPSVCMAQEEGEAAERFARNKINVSVGYTHIPEGAEDVDDEKGIWVFTLGVDYLYRLNEKWLVSGVVDVEFGDYLVIDKDLGRENATVVAALGVYEVMENWGVFAGGGVEFEQHKNLALIRIGTEYVIPLGGGWTIVPNILADIKQEFSSYALAVAVGKWF